MVCKNNAEQDTFCQSCNQASKDGSEQFHHLNFVGQGSHHILITAKLSVNHELTMILTSDQSEVCQASSERLFGFQLTNNDLRRSLKDNALLLNNLFGELQKKII